MKARITFAILAISLSAHVFAATTVRFLEFPAPMKPGDPIPTTVKTTLPCYGEVEVTVSAMKPVAAPAASYTIARPPTMQNQSAGNYSWSTFDDFSMYNNYGGGPTTYTVTFNFKNGAPDPNKLFLVIAGLAKTSTAKLSVPMTLVAERKDASKDLWCTTSCPNGSAPTLLDSTGTVVTSGYTSSNGTDERNSGYAFLQTKAAITTLSFNMTQQLGDGLGWTLAYVCCPPGAPRPDPDFQLIATMNAGNTTTFSVVANMAPLPAGAKFWWKVEEIDPATGATVAGTVMENPAAWWPTPLVNNFSGYTFKQRHTYRITRGVWNDCVKWIDTKKVVYMCAACDK